MTRCPKCGGSYIHGPRYERGEFGGVGDALRYTCLICNYSVLRPTLDKLKPPTPNRAEREADGQERAP
jgi:hypothetical protein